ncbi:hypothetical protein GCM10027431_20470 [Lysobacter rhizosphaerae]
MVEKIRLSLWDVFTFFMVGFLAILAATALLSLRITGFHDSLFSALKAAPAALSLSALAVACTLLGMLIEPFANFVNRYFLSKIFAWNRVSSDLKSDDAVIRDFVAQNCLGALSGKIQNPYHLCKDYVEYKQSGPTVMIFLSRFGFYRSCAFIALTIGVAASVTATTCLEAAIALISGLMVAGVLKRRGDEFYSYMAPAVFRAFALDKLHWLAASGGGDSSTAAGARE